MVDLSQKKTISFPDVCLYSQISGNDWPNYFSRVQTHGFVYTLRMNILACAQLKLDDSTEFQIARTICNQISIFNSINLLLFSDGFG
jgi:hypothetical protein